MTRHEHDQINHVKTIGSQHPAKSAHYTGSDRAISAIQPFAPRIPLALTLGAAGFYTPFGTIGGSVRPTWKGFLKLSLVNIPIRMYPAARSEALSFNQIHKVCNTRIKYDKRCPTCDRSVTSDEIVKGYEYAKEQYVIMDEEDFTKVRLESTKSIQIVQFVSRGEIDPLYYHGSHYLVPDGPVALESFATILKATEETSRIALARVVMSGKEQMVAIRPRDGAFVMSALYYADEIRSLTGIEELESTPEVNPEELQLAKQLIEGATKPFEPEQFRDNYREALLEIIKAKAEGKEIVEPPEVETGKVINLMEALKSSLEASVSDTPTSGTSGERAKASNE
jgi:DNA end-binding protein Ku